MPQRKAVGVTQPQRAGGIGAEAARRIKVGADARPPAMQRQCRAIGRKGQLNRISFRTLSPQPRTAVRNGLVAG
jgi:hypothetical protein